MKVTTDACVFGALAIIENPLSILDAGCGSGLLSLMVAQRFPDTKISAIDIDERAVFLSHQNFLNSPFKERLNVHLGDYSQLSSSLCFDAIICNPPFFKSGFLSTDVKRNIAMRDPFALNKVLNLFFNHLNINGQAWLMLPPREHKEFETLAQKQKLYCVHKINVENIPGKLFRIISMFKKVESKLKEENIRICNEDRSYTPQFKNLLKEFYLAF
jgi:tRNA1Val (adenine37-N6)-methyltransferase